VDSRGIVTFVNDFDFKGVDRFYTIRWHRRREPRGWVGHRREQKWFLAIQGTSLIAVVKPDRWESPASGLLVERFILSVARPQVLHVPPGYATASANLSPDAILMVFSSGAIEDTRIDDYRFVIDTWPVFEP
jgi:dTDP-4-dehydrorhamnose 3,5-epimerase